MVIFSAVRANAKGSLGHTADTCRMNVALTRAKYGHLMLFSTMCCAIPILHQLVVPSSCLTLTQRCDGVLVTPHMGQSQKPSILIK